MTGIFRSNNPLNASILFVYGLLLKLPYFIGQPIIRQQPSDGFLFTDIIELTRPVLENWHFVAASVTYLLLFVQALTINFYINSEKMMAKPNYLPAMSYLLLTSLFPEWNTLSATLIINTILLWIFGKIMKLGNTTKPKETLFNLGFASGICTFFYLPSIILVFFILICIVVARPPKIAEWALVFLGFFTTWYFLFAWLFLSDKIYSFYIGNLNFDLPEVIFNNVLYAKLGAILILFLTGTYFMQAEMSKQIIQVRNRWAMILTGVVLVSFAPLLNENEDFSNWTTSLFFLAPLAAVAYYNIGSKWIRIILHWSIVALVLFTQYFK